MARSNHIGSRFDELLVETANSRARVPSPPSASPGNASRTNFAGRADAAMTARMHPRRAALSRLLDENDTGLTLDTLGRGAQALGYRIKVELVEA